MHLRLLALIGLGFFLAGFTATMAFGQSTKYELGQTYALNNFCANEQEARNLTERVLLDGDVGYREYMFARDTQCFLRGQHYPSGAVMATLVEVEWSFVHPDNCRVFYFWSATTVTPLLPVYGSGHTIYAFNAGGVDETCTPRETPPNQEDA